LQLDQLTIYALGARGKHDNLIEHGATSIDDRTQDFVAVKRVKLYGGYSDLTDTASLRIGAYSFTSRTTATIRPSHLGQIPLMEAARASALLEGSQVVGNLVLVAPELVQT
jgi:hypothetical protein